MKIKSDILQACHDYASKRVSNYKNEIDLIKEALENNKGGDESDDSGNSKLLNDLEKNSQYLMDAQRMQDILKNLNGKMVSHQVGVGSLVKTTSNNFFISISAGKIDVDGLSVFAISPNTPIGLLLMGKTNGDQITFNGNSFSITEVM